jgi:hypothetical protein
MKFTDPEYLVTRQYRDSSNLEARAAEFSEEQFQVIEREFAATMEKNGKIFI